MKKEMMQWEHPLLNPVYTWPESNQTFFLDVTTGILYVQKVYQTFDRNVFLFLQQHHHPNLPHIYSCREENGCLVTLEEYRSGQTLRKMFSEAPAPMTEKEKQHIIFSICEGLLFLHEAASPIVHGRIDADHILVDPDGIVTITGFESARAYPSPSDPDHPFSLAVYKKKQDQTLSFRQDALNDIVGTGLLMEMLFPKMPRYEMVIYRATKKASPYRFRSVYELRRAFIKIAPVNSRTFRFWPVPGFRSHKIWKGILACIGYALLLWFWYPRPSNYKKPFSQYISGRISTYIIILSTLAVIDMFTGYTGFFDKLPFMKSRYPLLRILGYAISITIILVFYALSYYWLGKVFP